MDSMHFKLHQTGLFFICPQLSFPCLTLAAVIAVTSPQKSVKTKIQN